MTPFFLRQLSTWLLCALLGMGAAQAQSLQDAGVRLSPEERARLQAILDQPIDPGSLNSTRSQIYRQKDMAAFKLGLSTQREQLLRE